MLEGPEVGSLPGEPVVEARQRNARVGAGGVGEQPEVACGGVAHLRIADDGVGLTAGGLHGHAARRHEVVVEVPADHINLHWVLGNKLLLGSVNANRSHFEMGIKDLALGDMMYPGVLDKILTNPVDGLENYREMMRLLVEDKSALKVFVDVADA